MTARNRYVVRIKKSAAKELDQLPNQVADKISTAILNLEKDPTPRGCKRLRGSDVFRIRHGSYRVLYIIDDGRRTIEVTAIGHRKDVYRNL